VTRVGKLTEPKCCLQSFKETEWSAYVQYVLLANPRHFLQTPALFANIYIYIFIYLFIYMELRTFYLLSGEDSDAIWFWKSFKKHFPKNKSTCLLLHVVFCLREIWGEHYLDWLIKDKIQGDFGLRESKTYKYIFFLYSQPFKPREMGILNNRQLAFVLGETSSSMFIHISCGGGDSVIFSINHTTCSLDVKAFYGNKSFSRGRRYSILGMNICLNSIISYDSFLTKTLRQTLSLKGDDIIQSSKGKADRKALLRQCLI
jgi:hypothetical protein